jgi:tRNA modification GTPase
MALAREAAAGADIVLWLQDLSVPEAAHAEVEGLGGEGARVVQVGTKSDLMGGAGARRGNILVTSARTGLGVEALKDTLVSTADAAGMREVARTGLLLNARHQCRLMEAKEPLADLLVALEADEAGEEVVATILGSVLARLGEISGRVFTEQVLGDIFARFCVGK